MLVTGIEVPDKAQTGERKRVVYGGRQRNKKLKSETGAAEGTGPPSAESAEGTGPPSAESAEGMGPPSAESAEKLIEESADLTQTTEDNVSCHRLLLWLLATPTFHRMTF